MRMRKKRHLEARLERAGERLIYIEGNGFYSRAEEERFHLFDWAEVFGNDHPIEVEIGCGKGQFILETAMRHPEKNYIAVEKISNVIISACENAEKKQVNNVRFLNCDAYNLAYYFPCAVAERIYLNFSTPYPQKSYAGKRLTNPKYLKIFSEILLDGGEIRQKTDSRPLFEYSVESFSSCGFILKNITLDLHSSPFAGDNIMTEYESNFSEKGMPIYALTAVKKTQ